MNNPEPSTFDRLAAPYDRGMAPLERLKLRQMRMGLIPQVRGRILEIGVGTGANFPFYPSLTRLTAVDESPDMLAVAEQRSSALGLSTRLGQADVEHLPFCSGAFDTVVGSLVLCSVRDQERALTELRRVLSRPGGQLLLLEHTRPDALLLRWLADLANVPWYAVQRRCHLNRDTVQAIVRAGFQVNRLESKGGGLFRLVTARVV